jgi:hypothetical protein
VKFLLFEVPFTKYAPSISTAVTTISKTPGKRKAQRFGYHHMGVALTAKGWMRAIVSAIW